MKWQDPTIQLVACGSGDPSWDIPVLEAMGSHVEYISAHHYTSVDELKDYYEIVGNVYELERLLRVSGMTAANVSAKLKKTAAVRTALDEWAIVDTKPGKSRRDETHKPEFQSTLCDALWVTSALNAIHRNCRTVGLANVTGLVNDIGPMESTSERLLRRAIFFPLALYAQRAGDTVVEAVVSCPQFSTKRFGEVDYLDVCATYNTTGKGTLALAMVNRRNEGPVVASIGTGAHRFKPEARLFTIRDDSPEAQNTFENPAAVQMLESRIRIDRERFEQTLPPHSISWLELDSY